MKNTKVSVVIVTRNRTKPLLRCLNSLKKSKHKIYETIVVDNGSEDKTVETVKKKYTKVKLIEVGKNSGAAEGRNKGAKVSKGNVIFFLDDDAYIDKDTIGELVNTMKNDDNIAVVQTKVLSSFNKKKILGIAHDINTTTSLITAYGINEIDKGQYSEEIDIPMVGTGWIIKKTVFNKVKGFDKKFFVPYEDSDISLRITKLGYRIVFSPNAKIWHDDLKPTEINPRIRSIGIASPERAFFVGRNKVYFMRKHSEGLGRLLFFGLLLPLFVAYHSFIILSSLRIDIFTTYLSGLISGFKL